jgi:hypothetical protein
MEVMRWRRSAAAAGLLAIAIAPGLVRAAAVSEVPVGTSLEAWYHVAPTEAGVVPSAGGVSPPPVPEGLPAVSPFPAHRLQVGLAAGVETARTYLRLATGSVSGDIVGGTLTLNVDPDPRSGSVTPEAAGLRLCLSATPAAAAEGAIGGLPPVNCSVSSEGTFAAGDGPTFTFDLAPFATDLGGSALVVVPSGADATARESWRVAIRGTDPADPASRIQAVLAVEETDSDSFEADFGDAGTFDFSTDSTDFDFEGTPGGSVSFDEGQLSMPEPAPQQLAAAPAAGAAQPSPDVGRAAPLAFLPEGFAYSGVFLLPLALVGTLGWFGANLTRPVSDTHSEAL